MVVVVVVGGGGGGGGGGDGGGGGWVGWGVGNGPSLLHRSVFVWEQS